MRGVAPGGRAAEHVARVLGALQEVAFGPTASRRFGSFMHAADRAGVPLPVVDGLIAAATLESGGRLVTGKARDFGKVPGLELVLVE